MERAVNFFFGLFGYLLLGLVLSTETARYLFLHTDTWEPFTSEYLIAAALTALWFILSLILLQIGFLRKSQPLIAAGFCAFTFVAIRILCNDFPNRLTDFVPLNNPFSCGLLAETAILLLLGIQVPWEKNKDYRTVLGAFSVFGMFTLLGILSIEWFLIVDPLPILIFDRDAIQVPVRSLSVLWSLYALLWISLGFAFRIFPLRVCGMVILFITLLKTAGIDSWTSYEDAFWGYPGELGIMTVANPYFITMLCPVLPALLIAVRVSRRQEASRKCSAAEESSRKCSAAELPGIYAEEQAAWTFCGIFGTIVLLGYGSVECYLHFHGINPVFFGAASLTVFWTLLATLFTGLAIHFRSPTLRGFAVVILFLALLKVLLIDLMQRPPVYVVPFWNLYAVPMILLAVMLMVLGYAFLKKGEEADKESGLYRFFMYGGVVFLWLVLSAECFQSVRLLQGGNQEAWKAQMALSILWSVFAGVLILAGFIFKAPILRWMAIALFAATLLKILLVDMAGVNELYRFGAVFGLAMVLSLAAWAYQRFKPENTDEPQ